MRHLLALMLSLLCFAAAAQATTPVDISWEDLIPQQPEMEDPLAGLSEEEAGFIEWIIYLRQYLPEEIRPENEEFHQELEAALPELKKKGFDIDLIIADRRRYNTAVNGELDLKEIRLSGYLLPLDLSGRKIADFLLVPYIGACIHAPPPPPNQIISAVTATPIAFRLEELFRPVTVTGTLAIERLSKELFLVDGSDDIEISYSLSVTNIQDYRP